MADIDLEYLKSMRKDLGLIAEVSGEEKATSAYIAKELRRIEETSGVDLHIATGVGYSGINHGVTAQLGDHPPVLGIRVEMDALPTPEGGALQMCGHDVHMAGALGAARQLAARDMPLPYSIRFIFQPAEETAEGTLAMMWDGAFKGLDAIVGMHVCPGLPTGTVGFCGNRYATWGEHSFKATIRGSGGHIADPSNTIDIIAALSELALGLNKLKPKRKRWFAKTRAIEAGTANIGPDRGFISVSVRYASPAAYKGARDAVGKVWDTISEEYGVEIEPSTPSLSSDVPPLAVDRTLTRRAAELCREALGSKNVRGFGTVRACDDLAYVAEKVPCVHIVLGTARPGAVRDSPLAGLHTPDFPDSVDESCMVTGLQALVACAEGLLADR